MVIDTSILVALTAQESGWQQLCELILADNKRLVSAASYLEAGVVLRAKKLFAAARGLEKLTAQLQLNIIPFDLAQSVHGIEAYNTFGKGTGHPAQLNFGDCATYALAKSTGEPLLALGNDFTQTDLKLVKRTHS